FRLVVAERSGAERDNLRRFIRNWKSDATPETVEQAPTVLIARNQSRFDQKFLVIFYFQMPQKHVASARRIANTEARNRFLIQSAIFQIRTRRFSFKRPFQLLDKK